jgi:phospholipid N-methyltransferase
MRNKRSFFQLFLKEKKMIGSISPSSNYLAEKMLENIDFDNCKTIVEIGPGTGVFTKKIIEKLALNSRLIVFELNTLFFEQLKTEISDSRVTIINDSAENLSKHLSNLGLETTDYIISSLPLSNFPLRFIARLLKQFNTVLTKPGKYVQFQYSLGAKGIIERTFSKVEISFTPLNLPPAFVYTCSKK